MLLQHKNVLYHKLQAYVLFMSAILSACKKQLTVEPHLHRKNYKCTVTASLSLLSQLTQISFGDSLHSQSLDSLLTKTNSITTKRRQLNKSSKIFN